MAALVAAGADVNARFTSPHTETPLHWAASSDDVAVLDPLLDAGADIDTPGAVIAGGTPVSDTAAFAQWNAANRLIERGARTNLWEAATLGLLDRLDAYSTAAIPRSAEQVSGAFWDACHGGQQPAAEYLLACGAQINWVPDWEPLTPVDAARRSDADHLAAWLLDHGAKPASELHR